jgi:hypothetical protein
MKLCYSRWPVQARAITLGIAAALALGVPVALGAAASPLGTHAIISALNAQRVANGIPGGVTENASWSAKCADHDRYMAATGIFGHTEDPSSPAYSTGGAWAGENSVIAEGVTWRQGDPFDDAPIHLIQLMSPELRQVGVSDKPAGYLCMTTFPGYNSARWTHPTVFTYPGNNTSDVPYSETPDELPFAPAKFIGLSSTQTTGFNIMVYAEGVRDGWTTRVTSASLRGPTGLVAVRTVDRMSAVIGAYLPPGSGFMIPVKPLRPDTTYVATVIFNHGEASKTWHFTTAPSGV